MGSRQPGDGEGSKALSGWWKAGREKALAAAVDLTKQELDGVSITSATRATLRLSKARFQQVTEVSADGIGVHTAEGRKIFEALRDFGAYITDDSARDGALLHVDAAAKDEFHWSDAHRAEMGRMVAALAVVTNNGPDAIGGGGEPRVPLLPELDEP